MGGGRRGTATEKRLGRSAAEKLPEDAYGWYLDPGKSGTLGQAGSGLGGERRGAWIGGTPHTRGAIGFPRTLDKSWA